MPTPNDVEALVLAGMFPVSGMVVEGEEIRATEDSFGRWDIISSGTLVMVLGDGKVFIGLAGIGSLEIRSARERLIRRLCPDQGVIVRGADLLKISAIRLASVAGCSLETVTA